MADKPVIKRPNQPITASTSKFSVKKDEPKQAATQVDLTKDDLTNIPPAPEDTETEQEAPKVAPKVVVPTPKPEAPKPEVDSDLLGVLIGGLEEGKTLNIERKDANHWVLSMGIAFPLDGKKAKPHITQEYKDFFNKDAGNGKSWHSMTMDEKYAYAQEISAEWAPHDDPRIDLMRMTQSVLKVLGIEKETKQEA